MFDFVFSLPCLVLWYIYQIYVFMLGRDIVNLTLKKHETSSFLRHILLLIHISHLSWSLRIVHLYIPRIIYIVRVILLWFGIGCFLPISPRVALLALGQGFPQWDATLKVWWRHQMETFSALLAKGQWHGALMFSKICAWINGWVNNREADDLRFHHAHYDVTVMECIKNSLHRRVSLYCQL